MGLTSLDNTPRWSTIDDETGGSLHG